MDTERRESALVNAPPPCSLDPSKVLQLVVQLAEKTNYVAVLEARSNDDRDTIESLRRELAESQLQLTAAKADLAQVPLLLDKAESYKGKMKASRKALQELIDATSKEFEEHRRTIDRINSENDDLRSTVQASSRRFVAQIEEAEETIVGLQGQVDSLREELAEAKIVAEQRRDVLFRERQEMHLELARKVAEFEIKARLAQQHVTTAAPEPPQIPSQAGADQGGQERREEASTGHGRNESGASKKDRKHRRGRRRSSSSSSTTRASSSSSSSSSSTSTGSTCSRREHHRRRRRHRHARDKRHAKLTAEPESRRKKRRHCSVDEVEAPTEPPCLPCPLEGEGHLNVSNQDDLGAASTIISAAAPSASSSVLQQHHPPPPDRKGGAAVGVQPTSARVGGTSAVLPSAVRDIMNTAAKGAAAKGRQSNSNLRGDHFVGRQPALAPMRADPSTESTFAFLDDYQQRTEQLAKMEAEAEVLARHHNQRKIDVIDKILSRVRILNQTERLIY